MLWLLQVSSARLSRIPSLWVQGSDESEGLASLLGVEMVEEVTGAEFAFATERIIQPSAGEADDHPAEHAQHCHRPGGAHPASVLVEGGV